MSALHRLASERGIGRTYVSAWGDERAVSDETLQALLGDRGAQPEAALAEARLQEGLPAVQVCEQGTPLEVEVILAEGGAPALHWRIALETGGELKGRVDTRPLKPSLAQDGKVRLTLPLCVPGEVALGYHQLELSFDGNFERPIWSSMSLISVPVRAHLPPDGDPRTARSWALTAQLYSLRSERNWGIGDFTDLIQLCRRAAAQGASAVGLNPLHALFPCLPSRLSPYSPSSRSFLNPIYLDVDAIPELSSCAEAQAWLASPKWVGLISACRASEEVDYPAVWRCKLSVLELLHRHFMNEALRPGQETSRGSDFRRFQAEGGEPLRRFALFEALQAHFLNTLGIRSWRDWPEPLRDPGSSDAEAFARAHVEAVERAQYLQWEAERQLEAAAVAAREAGMSLGIYRDVAVGVDPDGAEAWGDQALLVPGASIGAPPDLFNPNGQDWGLTPLSPQELHRRAYAPFISAVRANMRHAGAVRIDHVIGLKRLWWVPSGKGSDQGAYVSYPLEDLLGIVALESVRHRCVVVGEDLGTVPKGFREELERRGLLSYRILMFERDDEGNGEFLPPNAYPKEAAVAVSTHDLATLKGYWEGSDLALRQKLKLFPSQASAEEATSFRAETRRYLLKALQRQSELRLGPKQEPTYLELAGAAHRFLARAPSRILLVQLEDLLGQREQMNLPGTVDEHPNWRRKLAVPLERLFEQPEVAALADQIQKARKP